MSSTRAPGLDQKLRGEVALLGELRVVERLLGMLEIGAAVLPVGIEEQRVEALVEIVVMRDVGARAGRRIELREPPPEIAQQPLRPRPGQRLAASDPATSRVRGSPRSSLARSPACRPCRLRRPQAPGRAGSPVRPTVVVKRTATGSPVPSPNSKDRSARGRHAQRPAPDKRPQHNLQDAIHRTPQHTPQALGAAAKRWEARAATGTDGTLCTPPSGGVKKRQHH